MRASHSVIFELWYGAVPLFPHAPFEDFAGPPNTVMHDMPFYTFAQSRPMFSRAHMFAQNASSMCLGFFAAQSNADFSSPTPCSPVPNHRHLCRAVHCRFFVIYAMWSNAESSSSMPCSPVPSFSSSTPCTPHIQWFLNWGTVPFHCFHTHTLTTLQAHQTQ